MKTNPHVDNRNLANRCGVNEVAAELMAKNPAHSAAGFTICSRTPMVTTWGCPLIASTRVLYEAKAIPLLIN